MSKWDSRIDLGNYERLGEPDQKERGYAWHTAIGLQETDGLKPSEYLISIANKNINGDITIDEAKALINKYYEERSERQDDEKRTEEADKVSARITDLITDKSFTFSPVEYIAIHRYLFEGLYDFAGKIRDYNISKKEWVLKGETVIYANAQRAKEALEYDSGAYCEIYIKYMASPCFL